MNRCACGCGLATQFRFVNGHNGRLTRLLHRADKDGAPVLLYGQWWDPRMYAAHVSKDYFNYLDRLSRGIYA
jgi:hypothetical protein